MNDIENEDRELIADMFFIAKLVAFKLWIDEWYKLHFNVWKKWGQEVMHLHMHLLSDI
jgi:diadenosine tetraphosphate (Ap4A) HIT family hydrolase